MTLSLTSTHELLGWPSPEAVERPQGAGANIFATLVRDKVGRELDRFPDSVGVTIGVLVADPISVFTQSPLAVVVSFTNAASEGTLRELQRLCWNFSHSPTLITIEPTILRVWTCCEPPDSQTALDNFLVHQVTSDDMAVSDGHALENLAARALHWVNLVSGEFFSQRGDRFLRDGRADQTLLSNLRHIRKALQERGLTDDDVCHDLLARVIFVQFLFDRKDSDGAAALTASKLHRLFLEGVLQEDHATFASILANYNDAYALFEWLNSRFNGDLFPGKGYIPIERSKGWYLEKTLVKKEHLALLADFIRGDLDMPSGQGRLWPQYSFDVIPLEFISSIYETFVTERAAQDGIFYTPPHLVDFILDRVLPWVGDNWDLKILDPACGSGIFLVKAFQRLVHRWKLAHPSQQIRAEDLRRLLERNVFGVDKDPHAVRVACFSLYLAMCDEIEPRHYWTQVLFPTMREERLLCSDFFAEDRSGFGTLNDANTYDLVIGNAPWGDSLVTEAASAWAVDDAHPWTVANKDIGGLFLAKAAELTKPDGRIAMIQSANSLLFNGSPTARDFRRQLFSTYAVEGVYNLSALRFTIFQRKSHTTKTSISPACVIVMRPDPPGIKDRVAYVSPKQLQPFVDEFDILIEPTDHHSLSIEDAAHDPTIWTSLMWGGSRDRALLRKLRRFENLSSIGTAIEVHSSRGVEFGNRKRLAEKLAGHRLFDAKDFPTESLVRIRAEDLPKAGDLWIHDRESTDYRAFTWPQLIIKRSWQKATARFAARLSASQDCSGIVCNQSYVSVHAPEQTLLAAFYSFNSILAVYFLQLTSGRMAAYRPEALISELRNLPIPPSGKPMPLAVSSYQDLDRTVFDLFDLLEAERVLIEDMHAYTLPDFRGGWDSPGRQQTRSTVGLNAEKFLEDYCEHVIRVIKAGFGPDKSVGATIFSDASAARFPYRLVAIQLGRAGGKPVSVQPIETSSLLIELERLDLGDEGKGISRRGIYNQRITRIYDSSSGTPTIFIVKPDKKRYWTRSCGLRDGDDISADLFQMQEVGMSRGSHDKGLPHG
jgi:N-6 DNA Methylase